MRAQRGGVVGDAVKAVALVTGATGFIGGRLAQRLVEDGWSVRLLVRNPDRLTAALRAACDVVVGDLLDAAAVGLAVRRTTVIFHCAANVNTWDTWESYYAVNVTGVENLMHAILRENPDLSRLVHLSTVDVYGFPVTPCDETCAATGGEFGYGKTKLLGESLVREYCDSAAISYTIMRPCNVIGPGSQFITRIGRELKSGMMLKVDGGGGNAGLVHVDNLVDYLLWAAGAAQARGECYNVRDDYDVSWAMFLENFRTAIGGKGIVINLPYRVAEVIARGFEAVHTLFFPAREPLLHRLLVRFFGRTCGHSAEKLRRDSGCAMRVGYDESVERSCRWFLESDAAM